MLSLAIFVLEAAIKEAPHLADDIRATLGTGDPTPEDFAKLRARVQAEDYKKFVPQSAIKES